MSARNFSHSGLTGKMKYLSESNGLGISSTTCVLQRTGAGVGMSVNEYNLVGRNAKANRLVEEINCWFELLDDGVLRRTLHEQWYDVELLIVSVICSSHF
jgi:hypothetical protein